MDSIALVIINSQHTILPDQKRLLDMSFKSWQPYSVPPEGWTLNEIENVHTEIQECSDKTFHPLVVVFASPIPALIKMCTYSWICSDNPRGVLVFHNDNRVAKELPGGKIVHTVAPEGWVLV